MISKLCRVLEMMQAAEEKIGGTQGRRDQGVCGMRYIGMESCHLSGMSAQLNQHLEQVRELTR